MTGSKLYYLLVPLVVVLFTTTLAGTSPASAAPSSPSCTTQRVPVTAPLLGQHTISGVLCLPAGPAPSTVQVLVPGATYNHVYWDFPITGYSYARSAAAAGQATFAVDRFNTGSSDRLPSAAVTVDTDAAVLHQINDKLRAGAIGATAFGKVVSVGHSLGSVIVVEEAALYQDVDAVMLTGFSNYPSPGFVTGLATGQVVVPAAQASPALADHPLGDLSTPPGARLKYFYATGDYDPAVLAKDEATKDVLTAGELISFPLPIAGPQTALIRVPVLLANGSKDAIFYCGLTPCATEASVRATEASHFPLATSFDAYVLPGSGHDLTLAANRESFFATAQHWISQHVGG